MLTFHLVKSCVPCLFFFPVSTLIMYSQIVLLKTANTAKIFASLHHTKANSVLQSLLVLRPWATQLSWQHVLLATLYTGGIFSSWFYSGFFFCPPGNTTHVPLYCFTIFKKLSWVSTQRVKWRKNIGLFPFEEKSSFKTSNI